MYVKKINCQTIDLLKHLFIGLTIGVILAEATAVYYLLDLPLFRIILIGLCFILLSTFIFRFDFDLYFIAGTCFGYGIFTGCILGFDSGLTIGAAAGVTSALFLGIHLIFWKLFHLFFKKNNLHKKNEGG